MDRGFASMSPLSRLAIRVALPVDAAARVGWYAGHQYALRRLADRMRQREDESARRQGLRSDRHMQRRLEQLLAGRRYLAALLAEDLANVEAGIYPLPADHDGSLADAARPLAAVLFADLPRSRRRAANATRRARCDERGDPRAAPGYYLQNFHFQSGGWLTEESAERYDTQVEVLFKGTANAMRRRALPPLAEVFAGRDQRKLRLIDIGCGTGRFLDFVKQAWPRLPALGSTCRRPTSAARGVT